MKCCYEYEYKNGAKVGGHNLENIIVKDDKIILQGIDIIPTYYDDEISYWNTILDMNKIEYIKIEPMKEVE